MPDWAKRKSYSSWNVALPSGCWDKFENLTRPQCLLQSGLGEFECFWGKMKARGQNFYHNEGVAVMLDG